MGSRKTNLDRLLPRHETPGRVRIDWHVHTAKSGLFKKTETFATGNIVDLSLEGALISVAADDDLEVGDIVTVRFEGIEGDAEIRHRRRRDHATLYGVRFKTGSEFRAAIGEVVGELRGQQSELDEAWNRAN